MYSCHERLAAAHGVKVADIDGWCQQKWECMMSANAIAQNGMV